MDNERIDIHDVVDLNLLETTDIIKCPYCGKGKIFAYSATGMTSNPCWNCNRMVLWDFDNHTSYRASLRKFAS